MDTLTDWLTLCLAPKLSPNRIQKLLTQFHSPRSILQTPSTVLRKLGLCEATIQALRTPEQAPIRRTLEWLKEEMHHCVTLTDSDYPPQLATLPSPPPLIYVIGNREILAQTQLAIVGSRRATATGIEISYEFASKLAKQGVVITSGLAIGIDAAAHRACVQQQLPTIAVLGSGLMHIYPHRNRTLAQEISKHGAIVSEFPLSAAPLPKHFPQRNRIISGLSLGTLVIEASQRSGSLITAKFAADQGREVFAIPGSIRNPLSQGCHELIQNGAKLVQSVKDIMTELLLQPTSPPDKAQHTNCSSLDDQHRLLLECIGFELTSLDQMQNRSGLPVQQILSMLLNLELNGYINATPGGYLRVK